MKIKIKFAVLALLVGAFNPSFCEVNPEKLNKFQQNAELESMLMDCEPAQAQYDMEVNNVRARLLTGGDLWWDLQGGKYIVPKPAPGYPEVSAIFASGIWIGGKDPNGAIKLAGVTYRQGNATDFYPGPLDENGQTNIDVCNDWDRHFVVKGENIENHIARHKSSEIDGIPYPIDEIPDDVKYWPGRGNPYFGEKYDFEMPDQNLAEFFDKDWDGTYNPAMGDYPMVTQRGCDRLDTPDEIVFWMYNDNGGPHRLSQATPIQMEVHGNAFAYSTLDELNDMTFYKFKFINKASDDIRDCYFGLWVDPDLGCSEDDYIGCDVDRSMAFVYNEDAVDGSPGSACPGGIETYGDKIPMIGIDLFRGPLGPKVFCGVDQNGDKILCDPEPGTGEQDTIVELGMTSFVYQNRGVGGPPEATQDPNIDYEFYNILMGKWKDGTAITFGNTGFDPTSTDTTTYVFTGDPSDPNDWSMCTVDLPFDDRRMVQGSGPFLLQPGAKNELIFGVVFVPDVAHPCPSIKRLQYADDLAQSLFDNCFIHPPSPDAPDMIGLELDEELVLILKNDTSFLETNNAKEQYMEIDIMAPMGVDDPYYKFEGYKIYQLENPNVTYGELDDIEKARVIRQVDIKNGVEDIYNWFPLENPDPTGPTIWIPERQVIGSDEGIKHTFSVTNDVFNGNAKLKNGEKYYFTAIAYAYNNWMQYDVTDNIGQRTSYIQSRRNVRTYTYTPRPLADINIPSSYGDEACVTRIEGVGTSFNALDLADGEIESILDGSFDGNITYKPGNSPINPKIVNPLGIKDGKYRLEVIGDYNEQLYIENGAQWKLTNLSTGEVIASEQSIDEINEQVIHGRGFSIQVNQTGDAGTQFDESNGAISQSFEYANDSQENWWDAVPAISGFEIINEQGFKEYFYPFVDKEDEDDPNNELSRIGVGHFIPIKSGRWESDESPYITPAWKNFQGFAIAQNKLRLELLNNVDIVFTSDKSKWSKCVVVETAVSDYTDNQTPAFENREQFELRASPSIDQNGNEIGGEGMSYFPGYAIDVETGERLNIFFGENSAFNAENDAVVSQLTGLDINSGGIGHDMIWNPNNALFTEEEHMDLPLGYYNYFAGGQHYIYVTRQEYDGCESISQQLATGSLLDKVSVVSFITWTAIPLPKLPLNSLEEGLIPNEMTMKLRVMNPFNKEIDAPNLSNPSSFEAVGELPIYEFEFKDVEITGVVSTSETEGLNDILVSPNPYLENGLHGQGQTDNSVKITNLMKGSVVTIYTLDGKFIRQFSKEMGTTFIENGSSYELEWDLTSRTGTRVSKGMYIIHIAVPHLGLQKSIKWVKG